MMGIGAECSLGGPVGLAVRPALDRMLQRAGITGDRAVRVLSIVDTLSRESLTFIPASGARFSGICRNGAPWQFCCTLGRSGSAQVRFLTEVGAPHAPLQERTALAVARIKDILGWLGAESAGGVVDVLARLAPP